MQYRKDSCGSSPQRGEVGRESTKPIVVGDQWPSPWRNWEGVTTFLALQLSARYWEELWLDWGAYSRAFHRHIRTFGPWNWITVQYKLPTLFVSTPPPRPGRRPATALASP